MISILPALKRTVPLRIAATYLFRMKRAEKIYQRLLDKYGQDSMIYVQHYPGTGDIYLASAMFDRYTELQGTKDVAVMTVIGGAGKKVAQMFNIPRVEALSQAETDLLVRFAMFAGYENVQMRVTHYHPIKMTTGILDRLCSFKGTDFLSMYLDTAFQGLTLEDLAEPTQSPLNDEIDKIFSDNNLIPGKTVVLSPYANTTTLLGHSFWEKIAKHLIKCGFTVCTNSAGPNEPAINFTVPVCPSFRNVPAFLEKAGYMIALRSGFCEIAMTARCRQIILYPRPNRFRFGIGDLYDFFSFSNMGVREDLTEIVCKMDNLKKARRKVIKLIDIACGESENTDCSIEA